jgi:hypothetical protein
MNSNPFLDRDDSMEMAMVVRSASFRFRALGCWLLVFLWLGAVSPVFAQTPAATQPSPAPTSQITQTELDARRQQRIQEVEEEPIVVYPYGLAGVLQTSGGVVAGDENKRAFIRYSLPFRFGQFALQASAPLGDEPPTSVVQLDGLANKAKVGFQLSFGDDRVPSEEEVTAIMKQLADICRRFLKQSVPVPDKSGLSVQGCQIPALERADPEARRLMKAFRRIAWFITVGSDTGPEDYSFADAVTLITVETPERKWNSSAAVTAGALFSDNTYGAVSLRFDNAFKASDKQAVCRTSAPTACKIVPVGEPVEDDRKVVEIEGRRFLGAHLGIAGIARYDWETAEKSLEVPLYFVRDKKGGLRGGVSTGYLWSSDDDARGWSFVVFVADAFKLGG